MLILEKKKKSHFQTFMALFQPVNAAPQPTEKYLLGTWVVHKQSRRGTNLKGPLAHVAEI